ncbi:MAG: hypothetical protein ACR2JY_02155 [Chloroflexota bacterium]
MIYYNRALFQRAGVTLPTSVWTYDTFLNVAQALTNTQQSAPRYGYTTTPPGLAWISGPIWQNGGDVFDTSLTHCLLDATPALGALQFDADLTTRYAVVPPQAAAKTVSMSAGKRCAHRPTRRPAPRHSDQQNIGRQRRTALSTRRPRADDVCGAGRCSLAVQERHGQDLLGHFHGLHAGAEGRTGHVPTRLQRLSTCTTSPPHIQRTESMEWVQSPSMWS